MGVLLQHFLVNGGVQSGIAGGQVAGTGSVLTGNVAAAHILHELPDSLLFSLAHALESDQVGAAGDGCVGDILGDVGNANFEVGVVNQASVLCGGLHDDVAGAGHEGITQCSVGSVVFAFGDVQRTVFDHIQPQLQGLGTGFAVEADVIAGLVVDLAAGGQHHSQVVPGVAQRSAVTHGAVLGNGSGSSTHLFPGSGSVFKAGSLQSIGVVVHNGAASAVGDGDQLAVDVREVHNTGIHSGDIEVGISLSVGGQIQQQILGSVHTDAGDLNLNNVGSIAAGNGSLQLGACGGVVALVDGFHHDVALGSVELVNDFLDQLAGGAAHGVPEFQMDGAFGLGLFGRGAAAAGQHADHHDHDQQDTNKFLHVYFSFFYFEFRFRKDSHNVSEIGCGPGHPR